MSRSVGAARLRKADRRDLGALDVATEGQFHSDPYAIVVYRGAK